MNNNTLQTPKPITTRLFKPCHPSHWFVAVGDPEDSDTRCNDCDCRPYGKWGHLPCGTNEETWAEAQAAWDAKFGGDDDL